MLIFSLVTSVAPSAFAVVGDQVDVWFASGCFWGRQHDLIAWEQSALNRSDSEVSTIGGYAGGAHTGADGTVCYHNAANTSDYALLGHAEAVGLSVPAQALEQAAHVYFRSFIVLPGTPTPIREDYFDQGPGYRASVGLPGGMDSPLIGSLRRAAAARNITLRRGAGSDADTLGTGSVWVVDSGKFALHQAELCLQFHNNQTGTYPESYHHIKDVMLASGRLKPSGCPPNYVC